MKKDDWIGSSQISLDDAIDNALAAAGDHLDIAVVETKSSQTLPHKRHYEVRVVTYSEGV